MPWWTWSRCRTWYAVSRLHVCRESAASHGRTALHTLGGQGSNGLFSDEVADWLVGQASATSWTAEARDRGPRCSKAAGAEHVSVRALVDLGLWEAQANATLQEVAICFFLHLCVVVVLVSQTGRALDGNPVLY